MIQCSACDSTTTYITKRGYTQWHNHDGYWMCQKCYDKYVWHPYRNPIDNKKWNPIFDSRQLLYRYKTIVLNERKLKGQCELCMRKIGDPFIDCEGKPAKVKKTSIHHYGEYHDDDPLKDTIEVCNSCHMKQTWKLGQIKPNKQKNIQVS
jgi:hypothetical protein